MLCYRAGRRIKPGRGLDGIVVGDPTRSLDGCPFGDGHRSWEPSVLIPNTVKRGSASNTIQALHHFVFSQL
ncbi:MAG: hypothetical protein ACTSRW_12075 [Candidatus Helarchaeota archaeon]